MKTWVDFITGSVRSLRRARVTIGARLGIGFGLVLLLFACTTGFALYQMVSIERDMRTALQAHAEIGRRVSLMRQHIGGIYVTGLQSELTTQPDEVHFHAEDLKRLHDRYENAKSELLALTHKAADVPGLADSMKAIVQAEAAYDEIAQASVRRMQEAKVLVPPQQLVVNQPMVDHLAANVRSQFDHWIKTVDAAVALTAGHAHESHRRAERTATLAKLVQVAAAVVAIVVGIAAAGIIATGVARAVRTAVSLAERISLGDLSVEIPAGAADETGDLLRALARMREGLHGLVAQVREAALSIELASNELAAGNLDLSRRTEHVAGQLQRTASSVAQLTEALQRSVDSALLADNLAAGAAREAELGGGAVVQVVESMEGISSHSRKILEITGAIDAIALQTNVLALNAAVEAARAGDQGRGFAVVAEEVRALAMRSASAAKLISGLIDTSTEGVNAGRTLVQQAGARMETVVASAKKVMAAIQDISQASATQSAGIGEVGAVMTDIDRLTQQNAALVEQSAAAADSMKSQSVRLARLVSTFRLTPSG